MAALMKINDVSEKYQVTKRSLRYYEEIGLIESKRSGASQSRYYDSTAINKLEQIILLRSVNFSINQISQLMLSNNSDEVFCIFESRLAELDGKINELNYFKSVIGSFIEIGRNMGISKVNIYQLLKEQIYIRNNDERMINMEKKYNGDIVKLEFGLGIIPLLSPKGNVSFLDDIRALRRKLETETGREIPLIRICDNGELEDLQYRISVRNKTMIDNKLDIVPVSDRISQMLHYLEFTIKSYIDDISAK